jgi:hypothetical protein
MQAQSLVYCSGSSLNGCEKEELCDVFEDPLVMGSLVILMLVVGAELENWTGLEVKLFEELLIRRLAAAAYLNTPHSVNRCLNMRGLKTLVRSALEGGKRERTLL